MVYIEMKVGITPYFPTKIDFYYVHQFSCPLINCHYRMIQGYKSDSDN